MSIYLFYSNNSYVLLLCPNVVTPSTYTICVLSKVLKIFDGELISVRFMFLNGNISLFKNSYFLRKGHRLFQEDARAPLASPWYAAEMWWYLWTVYYQYFTMEGVDQSEIYIVFIFLGNVWINISKILTMLPKNVTPVISI